MKEEQFDINQVELAGTIKKIWSHGDLDIWLWLEFPNDGFMRSIMLRIPDGTVNGEMISLQKGEFIAVGGILINSPWEEPLTTFLENAKISPKRITKLEDTIKGTNIKRMSTRVDVFSLEKLDFLPYKPLNQVQLSGLVIKAWTYRGDNYARLAIYDKFSEIIEYQQPFPKRKAHYVTVLSPQRLKEKRGVRGQGKILIHLSPETVFEAVQELSLDLDLSKEELEAYTFQPSVYAHFQTVVIFG